jgi:3-oxoacyl-[acyl-carrier-protein] synthase-3
VPALITGVGSYLPAKRVTNNELARVVDTSDEWIQSKTGILARHIALDGEKASDLGLKAATVALERAELAPERLDLILVATSTADYRGFPSTACLIQDQLGAIGAGAMDVAAACTGFVYALETARAFVESGAASNVLVVGTEVMSRVLDWTDRNTCVLFGDGSGAVVVGRAEGDRGIVDSILRSEGSGASALTIPVAENGTRGLLTMEGRPVYNFAVRVISEVIQEMLDRNGVEIDQVAAVVPHQANTRIIKSAAKRLGIPHERFFMNIEEVANTSAASIPIALDALVGRETIRPGDLILTVGFGGGLTYGANLIRW